MKHIVRGGIVLVVEEAFRLREEGVPVGTIGVEARRGGVDAHTFIEGPVEVVFTAFFKRVELIDPIVGGGFVVVTGPCRPVGGVSIFNDFVFFFFIRLVVIIGLLRLQQLTFHNADFDLPREGFGTAFVEGGGGCLPCFGGTGGCACVGGIGGDVGVFFRGLALVGYAGAKIKRLDISVGAEVGSCGGCGREEKEGRSKVALTTRGAGCWGLQWISGGVSFSPGQS